MYEVSFSNSSVTSLTPATVMRNSRKRRKRQSPGFTPALAVDPITDELLIGDGDSGDILLCMSNFSSCTVYVDRSMLETNSVRTNVGKFKKKKKANDVLWLTICPSTLCGCLLNVCRFASW